MKKLALVLVVFLAAGEGWGGTEIKKIFGGGGNQVPNGPSYETLCKNQGFTPSACALSDSYINDDNFNILMGNSPNDPTGECSSSAYNYQANQNRFTTPEAMCYLACYSIGTSGSNEGKGEIPGCASSQCVNLSSAAIYAAASTLCSCNSAPSPEGYQQDCTIKSNMEQKRSAQFLDTCIDRFGSSSECNQAATLVGKATNVESGMINCVGGGYSPSLCQTACPMTVKYTSSACQNACQQNWSSQC